MSASPFESIQFVCEDFRNELAIGNSPSVSDFAQRVGENVRTALVRNLLVIDIEHRRRNGEVPDTVDYTRDLPEYAALVSNALYETVSAHFGGSSDSLRDSKLTFNPAQGNLLGEFQLAGELGRGGMGAVFEARHTRRGHHVALKILPTVDGRSLQYFKGEFRRMAEINHPNLIGLHSLQADGGVWFFTMELIRGTDFLSYVRPGGECEPTRLRAALPQLASALLKLHSENIIHCDLKPSNVLVDQDGRVVVLDFGLAFESGDTEHMSTDGIAGTPAYMAPEQAACQPLTGAADWYAVGAMLFQAITGELPINGVSPLEIIQKKQKEKAKECQPPVESLFDLASLADELLEIEPTARPSSLQIASRLSSSVLAPSQSGPRTDSLLVGREKQLSTLHSAFDQVRFTGGPSSVFVCGRSGEGKTSLVEHFLTGLGGSQVSLAGRCYDRESVPFKAMDGLVDQLTNHLRGLPESEAALMMPDDIGFFADLFPVLNRVEAVQKLKRRSKAELDQQQIRTRAFAALKSLLTRLTRNAPIILFSDDLQWGDEDSAEALFQILCGDEPPQLMFVGSYRSDETETSPFITKWRELTEGLDVQQELVTVSPLSIEECTQLAVQLIGQDNPNIRQMVFQFASETGGNPMLFIELIGCYDPAADSFEALPIEDLIARKLDRLPKSAKPLLEFLAVAGQRSELDELALASEVQQEAESIATAMRSEKLVRIIGEGDFISIDTYHDKLRETVLRCLAYEKRSSIHRSLASAIEAAIGTPEVAELRNALDGNHKLGDALKKRVFDLSYHFDGAGDSERAFTYACLAARQASQQFSQSAAVEQFSIAGRNLDETNERDRFRVALGMGRANCLLGNYEQAKEDLDGATELTTDPVKQADVLGIRGQVAHKMGDIAEAVRNYSLGIRRLGYRVPRGTLSLFAYFAWEVLVQGIHTITPNSWSQRTRELNRSEELAVELLNRNSMACYYVNSLTMLWTHLKALNLAETRKPSLVLAFSYGLHPAPAAAVGLADRGLRYSKQAYQIANEQSDLLTLGHIFTMRAMACFASGRYAEGIEFGLRGGEYLKSAGDPFLRFIAEIHAALCYWQQGKPREAIQLGIECFERSLKLGENASMAGALYILTLAVEGMLPHALLRSCFTVSEDNHFDHSNTLQSEGVWHLHYARDGDAVAALEKAWLRARQNLVLTPYSISGISWLLTAIRQYRQDSSQISLREKRELLRKTSTYIRQARCFAWMCPMAKPHLYREIGLSYEYCGNTQKALRWLFKSLDLADEFGSVVEASKTRIELARLSKTLGMPHDSDEFNEAKTTLKRIREETEAAVSARWQLR